MREPETFDDQIARLKLMADPDDSKWDLSDNDRAAIRMLLERSALALEQPEEPFTVEELETLETALGLCMAEWDKSPGDEPLASKLRAYIEKKAVPAQP